MILRVAVLGLVLVIALLLETVVFAGLSIAGHGPAVVALTVVGVGLTDGAEPGARYGFAAGLAIDLVGGGLLGLYAFVLVLVGWSVGVASGYLTGAPLPTRVLVGGVATAAAVGVYGLLSFLLDPGSVMATGLLRAVAITGLYSAALAPVLVGAVAALSRRAPGLPRTAR